MGTSGDELYHTKPSSNVEFKAHKLNIYTDEELNELREFILDVHSQCCPF